MKGTLDRTVFYIRLFFLTIFVISINAENVWECIEDSSESPTICTNQKNETVIFEVGDENLSLKAFGKEFTASFSSGNLSGVIKSNDNRYFLTLTEADYATAKIEVDEKLNFIGKEIEYFYDKGSDSQYAYYKGGYSYDEDNNVVKEGYGYAEYWNEGIYKGQFRDDEKHGAGELIFGKERLIGEFWNDTAVRGKYEYADGSTYEGDLIGASKHGFGVHIFPDSYRYVGGFKNDKYHGLGTTYFKNGATHHGEHLDGLKHGEGIYNYEPGLETKSFIGTYKNGSTFKGVYIDSQDRPIVMGSYKDNLLHGSGTRYFYKENGEADYILKGTFREGLCHGVCEELYHDGSSFRGEFENGLRKGSGSLKLSYSEMSGYFDQDGLQGNGTFIDYVANYEWVGPFINGKKHGQGVITFLNEGDKYSLTYNDDQYIGLEELSLKALQRNKRVALVIGNDDYLSNPLQFAVKDSQGITDVLENAGFEVIHVKNATQEIFLDSLYEFQRKIRQYGKATDVLFYYAGHASQVRGINYLNPVDTVINRESQLEIRSINVNRVFEVLNESVDGVKIAILDACRNNPFASSIRSAKSGLAQMNAPPGTIIAYSTAPGETAIDGSSDGLGIYTGSLVNSISEPGIKIEEVFKETRKKVVSLTNGEQIPWESSSLISDFYFIKEN